MNLLIVEDERMTREGLVESLDWPQIGVTKVFSAITAKSSMAATERTPSSTGQSRTVAGTFR